MSLSSKDEPYLHFRAPRQHGELLCTSNSQEIARGIKSNSEIFNHSTATIHGTSLRDLRQLARHELGARFNLATDKPWIVGGHQPELFHPGVWLKNFALDQIARTNNAVALNLVVDHDLCNHVAIRVPTISPNHQLELESVAWDIHAQGVPWERHWIRDQKLFENFAHRIHALLKPFGFRPLVDSVWEEAMHLNASHHSIGEIFAKLRHSIEKKHGLQTTEFFSRHLVQTKAFGLLLLHLIEHRDRYRRVHNDTLQHYREAHRLRSSAHPVPDLKRTGNEIEIPLWVHSTNNARRRAVFVGEDAGTRYLTDQNSVLVRWSVNDSDEKILTTFSELEEAGTFLRPRALLTTMALRLLVADWFIHGIGGGKYDQLNDRIMTAFFAITPPKFTVISGTLFLPLQHDHTSRMSNHPSNLNPSADPCAHNYLTWHNCRATWLKVRQLERQHQYHPEKYLQTPSSQQDQLLQLQRNLLSKMPARGAKLHWHQQVDEVRSQLAEQVKLDRDDYATQIELAYRDMQQTQIRISREFSFVLFPETWLIPRLKVQSERCGLDSPKTTVHTSPQTSATEK